MGRGADPDRDGLHPDGRCARIVARPVRPGRGEGPSWNRRYRDHAGRAPDDLSAAAHGCRRPPTRRRPADSRGADARSSSSTNLEVYYGSFRAVREVTLTIRKNEITAFIGPSGCGKTTVLRCLNRMNDLIPAPASAARSPTTASISYGADVSATEVRRRIGMVFQKPNPFPKSIYDNVAYGPRINGVRSKAKLDEIVERSLRGAALWDEVKDRLKSSALGMSGGQQQRLCIARAIAVEPEVILMDEPCSALDPIATARIEELMQEIKSQLHDRHRHPQHAAGRAGQRPHRLLPPSSRHQERPAHRRARRVRPDRSRSSSDPRDERTQAYVTGRFGWPVRLEYRVHRTGAADSGGTRYCPRACAVPCPRGTQPAARC